MRASVQAGFTLIELMLVIVIGAILVGIGAPSFRDLVLSTRIKNGASDIYSTLIYARSEAIKRGSNVTVTPVSSLWTNGWAVAAGGTTLKNQDAVTNIKIECPSGTPCADTLTYRRDGRLDGITGPVSIIVDIAGTVTTRRVPLRCVTISVSGQINVLADNNLDGSCTNG
jgi:type IV fimbrial biogenesis protein FimT